MSSKYRYQYQKALRRIEQEATLPQRERVSWLVSATVCRPVQPFNFNLFDMCSKHREAFDVKVAARRERERNALQQRQQEYDVARQVEQLAVINRELEKIMSAQRLFVEHLQHQKIQQQRQEEMEMARQEEQRAVRSRELEKYCRGRDYRADRAKNSRP